MIPSVPDPDVARRREALRRELRGAEEACQRLRAGLLALGEGARLPGVHPVARAGGVRVIVPGGRVAEIAAVVACEPLPGAPAGVVGSFLWRGRPAIALDLAVRLGGPPCSSHEDLLLVLDGEPTVALRVEEVCGLAEDPAVAAGGPGAGLGPFLGVCSLDGETIAILAPEALEREIGGCR